MIKNKIGIYCRTSQTEEEGLKSINSQKESCSAWLKENYTDKKLCIDVYVDIGFSSRDKSRPALDNLKQDIKDKKINKVVCVDFSRIGRNFVSISSFINYANDNGCDVDFVYSRELK